MTITVDARGLACPAPVIRTKEAAEKNPGENIIVIVDNDAAKENVSRLAEKLKFSVNVKEGQGEYTLNLTPGDACAIFVEEAAEKADTGYCVVLISSDKMGEGAEELGKILIKGFFYALTQSKPFPKALIFINAGVRLTTEGSEAAENIRLLEDQGVEVLSCGTCLDYYGLKEKLLVGKVSNMYTIVEKLNEASKVIRI